MYNLFIVVFILPILPYHLSLSKLKLLFQEFYCTLCLVCSFSLLFFHEFHLSPMTFLLYSIYLNSFHPLIFRLSPGFFFFFGINQVFIKLITMIDTVSYINRFRDNMNSLKKRRKMEYRIESFGRQHYGPPNMSML